MDNEIHEKLFSPSMWNKRFSPDDVVSNFIKIGEQVTSRARKNTSCKIDIPYGPSERERYDLYGTDLPNDAPIFVFLHGGYWQMLNKEIGAGFPIENCVSQGIKVICVGYDLCPNVQLRNIVKQIKTVTHKLLEDAVKSGSRGVWIGGHSAGAHLAASLLDPEWFGNEPNIALLKGLVLVSGIYFLEPLVTTTNNDALKLDNKEAKLLSTLNVEFHAPVQNFKVLVVVGECESPEFIDQSRRITKKLCSNVDQVEYILIRSNTDHFDILENFANKKYLLSRRMIEEINNYNKL